MMCFFEKKKKTNYGKIVAITLAAVAGTCAVAYFVYKLFGKFCGCCECDCGEDFLDELDGEYCACEDCECECACECDESCEDEACECGEAEADAE